MKGRKGLEMAEVVVMLMLLFALLLLPMASAFTLSSGTAFSFAEMNITSVETGDVSFAGVDDIDLFDRPQLYTDNGGYISEKTTETCHLETINQTQVPAEVNQVYCLNSNKSLFELSVTAVAENWSSIDFDWEVVDPGVVDPNVVETNVVETNLSSNSSAGDDVTLERDAPEPAPPARVEKEPSEPAQTSGPEQPLLILYLFLDAILVLLIIKLYVILKGK